MITIENIFQIKMTVYNNFNTLREAFNNGYIDIVEMRSQFERISVAKSLKKMFNKELKKSSAKKRFPKGQSTNVGIMPFWKSLKMRFNKELKKSIEKKRFPKGQSTNVGTMLLALARENPGQYHTLLEIGQIFAETDTWWNFSSEWGGMPVIHHCDIGDRYENHDNPQIIKNTIQANCLNPNTFNTRVKDGSLITGYDLLSRANANGTTEYYMRP